MRRPLAPALAVAFALASLCACQGDKQGGFGMDNQGQLPDIKVDMPEVPSFQGGPIPLSYPDGTQSVVGLERRMEKYLGQEVKVTGFVVDVYACPPEIKNCKGADCKNCEKPHFYVGDDAAAKLEKTLIVSDYLSPGDKVIPGEPGADVGPLDTSKLKGQQVIVDAVYGKSSEAGFKSSDGVLSLKSVTPVGGATAQAAQH